MICEKYLPLTRNTTSVTHTHIAITITVFSLFQMAILPSFLKVLFRDGDHNESDTYIRNIINSEAEPKTMLGRVYDK